MSIEKSKPERLKADYCPICKRVIEPCNKEEVESGRHKGLLFVHDEVIHTDSDIQALKYGIN